ncbi:MAG: hypothetical protein D6681_01125 [Calditrichaeota bacterium]|nr:MAG: hypothetical protein D6681_01125 [Calditrichota bacterium]
MSKLRKYLARYLMKLKARLVVRRLNDSLNFPVDAHAVRKVLVILPRNLNLLDRATHFIQSLRKTYPGWEIELFDVDKLSESQLTRLHLPQPEVLERLRYAGYHFVLDLNDRFDDLSSFIALMTEAPYRLHLHSEDSLYHNMTYHAKTVNGELYYEPLLSYLRQLFVKEA